MSFGDDASGQQQEQEQEQTSTDDFRFARSLVVAVVGYSVFVDGEVPDMT